MKTFKIFEQENQKEKIINLIKSKDKSNIELAIMLWKNLEIDLSDFLEKVYKLNKFFFGQEFKNNIEELFYIFETGVYENENIRNFPIEGVDISLLACSDKVIMSLKNLKLKNLESLKLDEWFPNMNTLRLNQNLLTKIPLNVSKSLKFLGLNYNKLTSLKGIEKFENLIVFRCDENVKLKDLTPLKELNKLTTLSLSDNSIEDLTPLKELEFLGSLEVANNPLNETSLNLLTEMTSLKNLIIDKKFLTDSFEKEILKNNPNIKIN